MTALDCTEFLSKKAFSHCCLHFNKNNMNFPLKTEPVKVGATVYTVCLVSVPDKCKQNTDIKYMYSTMYISWPYCTKCTCTHSHTWSQKVTYVPSVTCSRSQVKYLRNYLLIRSYFRIVSNLRMRNFLQIRNCGICELVVSIC